MRTYRNGPSGYPLRLLGILSLLLALLLPGLTPAPALAQASNVEPKVGQPGTTFAFFARGFDDNEYVGYWVNAPDGTVVGDIGFAVDANEDGRADWNWTSPQNASSGRYVMNARGGDSGWEVQISFEITSDIPPASDGDAQDANAEPKVGQAGTTFAFFARGFIAGERVAYWVNRPDGTVDGASDYAVFANNNGRADWSWQAPGDAPPGFYTMVAQGTTSGRQHVLPFELR